MRRPRNEHPLALLAVGGLLFAACVGIVGFAWFALTPKNSSTPDERSSLSSPLPPSVTPGPAEDRTKLASENPILAPLERAAQTWKGARGLRRRVVDQVYLVPDFASFLEAIGEWNAGTFFPILIDDPNWTLPFLRAFHPSRVVRFSSKASIGERAETWTTAIRAIGRSWSRPGADETTPIDGSRPPRDLGKTPPGVVLGDPDSPTLAGGVALAAGRFQPLMRFDTSPDPFPRKTAAERPRYSTILPLAAARALAKRVEQAVSSVIPAYQRLGDDCDFLTVAGDWPYRYLNDRETGQNRGEAAIDDLLGRVLEPDLASVGKSRDRWAFVGRLIGDAPASVYQAMCSLFLPPDSTLLWNTYGSNSPWHFYAMDQVARLLALEIPGPSRYRAGADANLVNWHRIDKDSFKRCRIIFFNSSGDPKRFSIEGGQGRPADIPPGGPASILMIHSFSAANPLDPRTIAGRWLTLGAFNYMGSINEPYLAAFRPPLVITEALTLGLPLGAAVRQGPAEPFGQPWRLVFLGDPLYLFDHPLSLSQSLSQTGNIGRVDPRSWKPSHRDSANVKIETIAAGTSASLSTETSATHSLFQHCLTAAILDTLGEEARRGEGIGDNPKSGADWRTLLWRIERALLPVADRPVWDALVVNAACLAGGEQEAVHWHERLSTIPVDEWSPKVEAVMEYRVTDRLSSAIKLKDFQQILMIWDEAIRRHWPAGSEFCSQITERVASQAVSRDELQQWLGHLRKAEATLPLDSEGRRTRLIVVEESKRIEAKLSGKP